MPNRKNRLLITSKSAIILPVHSFSPVIKVSLAHLLNIVNVAMTYKALKSWYRPIIVIPKVALITVIKGYQRFISPLLGPHCRFNPTCSSYAIEAINCHGMLKGSWLAVKRILKCHPLSAGGDDPVPDKSTQVKHQHEK